MHDTQYRRLRCGRRATETRALRRAVLWLLAVALGETSGYTLAHAQTSPPPAREAARAEPPASATAPRQNAESPLVPLVQTEHIKRTGKQDVRVPLQAAKAAPRKLVPDELLVVAGSARVARTSDGSVVLEQAKRGTSVLSAVGPKASSPHSLVASEQKLQLPWLVVDSQAQDTHNVVRSARPFLKLARAVQWDPVRKVHYAEFLLGLDAESGATGALAEPLDASLAVSCDRIEPRVVRFTEIGPAGDQLVRVECSAQVKNERAQHELSLRLQGAEYNYNFEIPHRPGRFDLQASSSSVLGMGLGELTLTAVQREEDGTPLVANDALVVPLHVSDGEVVPDSLTIPAGSSQGQISVHLRGRGRLALSAGQSQRESAPLLIEVRWPLLLSCMAPLGGAVGGFLAVRWQRKHPAKRRPRKRQHAMAVIEGAVVGTVLVLTLMLIPSMGLVPDWARTAEIAWFVAAVFAGFLGLELLDRVARWFFRQRRSTEPSTSLQQSTARSSQE